MRIERNLAFASSMLFFACMSVTASSAPLKPVTMTCAQFFALGDEVKPKVLFWAEGFNQAGKPVDAVVDVGEADTLVPILVTECRKAPKASLASTIARRNAALPKSPPKVVSTSHSKAAQAPASMSCSDFLVLDDLVQPSIVYWVEGYTKQGTPIDAYFDVSETDTLLPVLIDECKATPRLTLWERFNSHL